MIPTKDYAPHVRKPALNLAGVVVDVIFSSHGGVGDVERQRPPSRKGIFVQGIKLVMREAVGPCQVTVAEKDLCVIVVEQHLEVLHSVVVVVGLGVNDRMKVDALPLVLRCGKTEMSVAETDLRMMGLTLEMNASMAISKLIFLSALR